MVLLRWRLRLRIGRSTSMVGRGKVRHVLWLLLWLLVHATMRWRRVPARLGVAAAAVKRRRRRIVGAAAIIWWSAHWGIVVGATRSAFAAAPASRARMVAGRIAAADKTRPLLLLLIVLLLRRPVASRAVLKGLDGERLLQPWRLRRMLPWRYVLRRILVRRVLLR